MNYIIFCAALLFLPQFHCLSYVPVLIVDSNNVSGLLEGEENNPFKRTTVEQFTRYLDRFIVSSNAIIIFVDDELSPEVLSSRDTDGSPFKEYLQDALNHKKLIYLPQVDEPFKALTDVLPPKRENLFILDKDMLHSGLFRDLPYFYVRFKKQNYANRFEQLRSHNTLMKKVVKIVSEYLKESLIVIYTGIFNPLSINDVKTAKIIPGVDNGVIQVKSDRVFFKLELNIERPARAARRFAQNEPPPTVKKEEQIGNHLYTTLEFADFDLQFQFKMRHSDWVLDNIVMLNADTEVGRTRMGYGAPYRRSYYCTEPLRVVNLRDASVVTLMKYKFQPFQRSCEMKIGGCKDDDASVKVKRGVFREDEEKNTDDDERSEEIKIDELKKTKLRAPGDNAQPGQENAGSDQTEEPSTEKPSTEKPQPAQDDASDPCGSSVHCGPYFSREILSGLLVTFIILGIFFVGLVTMMNCSTNDRFDNFGGKSFVITSENK